MFLKQIRFFIITQNDEADAGISNLIIDLNDKEGLPWHFCLNSSVSRSEVFSYFLCSGEHYIADDYSLFYNALPIIKQLWGKINLDYIVT